MNIDQKTTAPTGRAAPISRVCTIKTLDSISHYIIPHATWSKLTHQPNNILKLFMALYERAIPTTLDGMPFKINF